MSAVVLSQMKARTRQITVPWDGEEVDVSYFPHAVTPAMLEDIDRASEDDDRDLLGTMLEPLVDWWDILEVEGGPRMPATKETVKLLPMSFINALQTAMGEANRPPE